MATELKIIDGVLLDCQTDAKTATIPKAVKYVSKHAFDTCENVNIINLYPDYVDESLTATIDASLENILIAHRERDSYDDYEEYEPSLTVWDADTVQIEKAIAKALAIQKAETPDIEWQTIVIDANDIGKMTDAMKQAGRENILHKDGDTFSTIYNLPLIPYDGVQSVMDVSETAKWIERQGFGILYVKGVNKNNYNSLGHNFDYNLIKYHTFGIGHISPNWLIVIGTEVRLDVTVYSSFSARTCWMEGPKEYLEYMASIGRVVD